MSPTDGYFDGAGNWCPESDSTVDLEQSVRKVRSWVRESQAAHRGDYDKALSKLLGVPLSDLHPERLST